VATKRTPRSDQKRSDAEEAQTMGKTGFATNESRGEEVRMGITKEIVQGHNRNLAKQDARGRLFKIRTQNKWIWGGGLEYKRKSGEKKGQNGNRYWKKRETREKISEGGRARSRTLIEQRATPPGGPKFTMQKGCRPEERLASRNKKEKDGPCAIEKQTVEKV